MALRDSDRPFFFSAHTGHFRSSLHARSMSASGMPLPWYTYPCIDFLQQRSFEHCKVLEFGGGQSTTWWARRAARVMTLEGDDEWYNSLESNLPENAELHSVSMVTAGECQESVEAVLTARHQTSFDIIVIDGLFRYEMIEIAVRYRAAGGAIILRQRGRVWVRSRISRCRAVACGLLRLRAGRGEAALHVDLLRRALVPVQSRDPDPGHFPPLSPPAPPAPRDLRQFRGSFVSLRAIH